MTNYNFNKIALGIFFMIFSLSIFCFSCKNDGNDKKDKTPPAGSTA